MQTITLTLPRQDYARLRRLAECQTRTPEGQALHILRQAIGYSMRPVSPSKGRGPDDPESTAK